ncbi:MAG: hypothetical protein JO061_13105 [Acidobacteriaceae bacterium]|nr:hypothetical protein [Acidobacteriaceae bacterium]
MLVTLDELSACISDLERDGKAMPVLIRQYAKVGGRFLGFSVDRNFSNTLDGLIMADLRKAPPEVLLRWMGRTGASAFQAHHATPQS